MIASQAVSFINLARFHVVRDSGNGKGRNVSGQPDSKAAKFRADRDARRNSHAEALKRELAERGRDLAEAREQQAATIELLKMISRSTFDPEPVLETVVEAAKRLCGAERAHAFTLDGDLLRLASAGKNMPKAQEQFLRDNPLPLNRGSVAGRAATERRTVQIEDCRADTEYQLGEITARYDGRTLLGVPMLKGDDLIGVITVVKSRVDPFTKREIDLVSSFADQAVIAVENARLMRAVQQRNRELAEALEQQTATAEILAAISGSLSDAQPVFDAIVASGLKLFPGCKITIAKPQDSELQAVAVAAQSDKEEAAIRDVFPIPLTIEYLHSVAFLERRLVDLHDALLAPDDLKAGAKNMLASGNRAITVFPLVRGNEAIGSLSVMREQPGPLLDKQLGMFKTFADQAMIAIENARLLEELRESLQQQTATADVLKVISRSAFDLQTVLDTLTHSAANLCEAENAWIFRRFGEIYRFSASFGFSETSHTRIKEFLSPLDVKPGPGTMIGRTAKACEPVQIVDVLRDEEYSWGELQKIAGYRSVMGVPLLRDGETIGILALSRTEVRPFTEKQVELATTFADQAVIAIENVRLFEEVQARTTELQQSLEYQTATSDVLGVISRSPNEIQPVFDAIVHTTKRLCEADDAHIFRLEDGEYKLVAHLNSEMAKYLTEYLLSHPIRHGEKGSVTARAASCLRPVHVPDTTADPEYDKGLIGQAGRSVLAVPLVRNDTAIGVITVQREVNRPFTQKQIGLVSTFADQAVISINNVELFDTVETRSRELRESLDQQIATADVLKVISRSAFNLQNVLTTLVEAAARLCRADQGTIARELDGKFGRVASYGFSAEFEKLIRVLPVELGRGSAVGRALTESCIVHIPDILDDPEYTFAEGKKLGGYRTILAVPMLREGRAIGVLALTRFEPDPFNDKEIELVGTFADQAAIAIENVRLFEDVETRSRELEQSLNELRAAQDRLVQTEKLASLGQLTAGIAHEIKNPLNFVNNFASVSVELIDELNEAVDGLRDQGEAEENIRDLADILRGNMEKIVQHGQRADSIVKNMLLHARQGSDKLSMVDINALVEESLNLAYHGARAERQGFNITLERSFATDAGEVELFPQDITRVLLNLFTNGIYATTKRKENEQGDFEPTLTVSTKNLGSSVEITVRDNGTGIHAAVKDKLFSPFFTTKPAGEGTGLGLSISHDIVVTQHRGKIEVETELGKFTAFRIILPRIAAGGTP